MIIRQDMFSERSGTSLRETISFLLTAMINCILTISRISAGYFLNDLI